MLESKIFKNNEKENQEFSTKNDEKQDYATAEHTKLIQGFIRQNCDSPFPSCLAKMIESYCPIHSPHHEIVFHINVDVNKDELFVKHPPLMKCVPFMLSEIIISLPNEKPISFYGDENGSLHWGNFMSEKAKKKWNRIADGAEALGINININSRSDNSRRNSFPTTTITIPQINARVFHLIKYEFPGSLIQACWSLSLEQSFKYAENTQNCSDLLQSWCFKDLTIDESIAIFYNSRFDGIQLLTEISYPNIEMDFEVTITTYIFEICVQPWQRMLRWIGNEGERSEKLIFHVLTKVMNDHYVGFGFDLPLTVYNTNLAIVTESVWFTRQHTIRNELSDLWKLIDFVCQRYDIVMDVELDAQFKIRWEPIKARRCGFCDKVISAPSNSSRCYSCRMIYYCSNKCANLHQCKC